jgi:Ser/Thr protein kinase RdoA (MazF antagonist)
MNEENIKDSQGQLLASTDVYAELSPEMVLDAMHSRGFFCDGRLLALNSYENRVYQLGVEDGQPLIAKFYRPHRWSNEQILEEHAFVAQLAAFDIPVVPAFKDDVGNSLSEYRGFRFAVFPRQGGRAPELDRPETLTWLGRYLGRIHAIGRVQAYSTRPSITLETFGGESLNYLIDNQWIPSDLRQAYMSTATQMLEKVARGFECAGDASYLRLHGDCHMGNVLWLDDGPQQGPHFVDFDDSRMGPAIQDLWMLLSGSRREMQDQLCEILVGYEDFSEFNSRELALIEPLRCLRLLHYSAWLAQRWSDPAFIRAFPWFNTQRYWQDRILEMREQLAVLDEEPLRV